MTDPNDRNIMIRMEKSKQIETDRRLGSAPDQYGQQKSGKKRSKILHDYCQNIETECIIRSLRYYVNLDRLF